MAKQLSEQLSDVIAAGPKAAEPTEEPNEFDDTQVQEDEPKVEPKAGEQKAAEPEPEPEGDEPSEEEDKDAIISELRKKLNEAYSAPKQEQQPTPEPDPEPVSLGITKDEIEEAQYDAEKMAALLERVYSKAREDALRSIPSVVSTAVTRQTAIQAAVNDFYSENEDLREHMGYVGYVVQQVEGEHPDWSMQEVLSETAKRARSGLGIREQAAKIESDRKKKPAFAGKPKGVGRGVKGDTLSPLQKQLADIINV